MVFLWQLRENLIHLFFSSLPFLPSRVVPSDVNKESDKQNDYQKTNEFHYLIFDFPNSLVIHLHVDYRFKMIIWVIAKIAKIIQATVFNNVLFLRVKLLLGVR